MHCNEPKATRPSCKADYASVSGHDLIGRGYRQGVAAAQSAATKAAQRATEIVILINYTAGQLRENEQFIMYGL